MTKDGKPSRITDIRYFVPIKKTLAYLQGHEQAKAFGNRLTWLLNSENFSCGTYPALYIVLDSTREMGAVQVEEGAEWWHRHVHVGVPKNFPNIHESGRAIQDATTTALKFIRPDLKSAIDGAAEKASKNGENLRFLLQVKESKKYLVEVYFNIPVSPETANLYTGVTDQVTGQFFEGPPLPIGPAGHAPFDYKGPIRLREIEKELAGFVAKPRPTMSKLVQRK